MTLQPPASANHATTVAAKLHCGPSTSSTSSRAATAMPAHTGNTRMPPSASTLT